VTAGAVAPERGTLAGIRVLELGQILSAPFAGMIFADLGAEVIKVEKPDGGDDQRRMGPALGEGDALAFHEINRGKLSVTIDLKTLAGIADLERLVDTADVLIHNLRPGVAESLGIGAEAMRGRNPRLIYCAISGFGRVGPLSAEPAFEPIAQAFSGLCSVNGEPGGPPVRIGCSVVDFGTGMWSVIAVLSALHQRETTGHGATIDCSLLETAMTWASPHVSAYLNLGREPARQGTAHPTMVPYQAFETLDGPLMVAAGNDRLFAKLAGVVGHAEWAQDERFRTNRARMQSRPELIALLESAFHAAPRADWIERLRRAGVPCTPMNTIAEAVASPQTAALGQQIRHVAGSELTLSALPLSFEGRRPSPSSLAPKLGEHNAALLGRTVS